MVFYNFDCSIVFDVCYVLHLVEDTLTIINDAVNTDTIRVAIEYLAKYRITEYIQATNILPIIHLE